jgi:antitoxin component YwqK of YwqJK toxin-antitoxin module
MRKKEKIISLNDFKENRKLVALDGTPYTGVYTDYYDWENDQKEYEEYYKDGKENGLSTWWYENGQKEYEVRYEDGKENGLCTWWYENGQIECEVFFKDGTEVDDPRTELDENELSSPFNAYAKFIQECCLTFFYAFLGVTLSSYIFDVWL